MSLVDFPTQTLYLRVVCDPANGRPFLGPWISYLPIWYISASEPSPIYTYPSEFLIPDADWPARRGGNGHVIDYLIGFGLALSVCSPNSTGIMKYRSQCLQSQNTILRCLCIIITPQKCIGRKCNNLIRFHFSRNHAHFLEDHAFSAIVSPEENDAELIIIVDLDTKNHLNLQIGGEGLQFDFFTEVDETLMTICDLNDKRCVGFVLKSLNFEVVGNKRCVNEEL